jgi:hypothetical protein
MTDTVIDFVSRECKTGQHENCRGKWQGLGFEINCNCICGHKENCWSLDQVHQPVSNTNYSTPPVSVQGVASR